MPKRLELLRFLEVTKKDLKAEIRSKSVLSLMLLFSLTSAFLFSAATLRGREVFAPLLFVVFIFTGVLGYSISFLKEFDSETIEGLKASPLTPQEIIVGKMLFSLFLMFMVQFVVFPVCFALFNIQGNFLLSFTVFTICNSSLAIVITALAPLSSQSRARELLLPTLLFPIVFPIISSTIKAVNAAISGSIAFDSIVFILAYTGIIISLSMLTSEYVMY